MNEDIKEYPITDESLIAKGDEATLKEVYDWLEKMAEDGPRRGSDPCHNRAGAVVRAITASGNHILWADSTCETLHLVDTVTGTHRTRSVARIDPRRVTNVLVGGAYVGIPESDDKVVRWGPDGESVFQGKLSGMNARGDMLLKRGEAWLRVAVDGRTTTLAGHGSAPRLLNDGGYLRIHGDRVHVFDPDGGERGWAWAYGLRGGRVVEHPAGGLVLLGPSQSIQIDDLPHVAVPDWIRTADPEVRSAIHDKGDDVVVVGPEGKPVPGAWVQGVRADGEGRARIERMKIRPSRTKDNVAVVDGRPRMYLRSRGRVELWENGEIKLPPGLSGDHLVNGHAQLGPRTGPNTYLWKTTTGRPLAAVDLVATVPAPMSNRIPLDATAVWHKPTERWTSSRSSRVPSPSSMRQARPCQVPRCSSKGPSRIDERPTHGGR